MTNPHQIRLGLERSNAIEWLQQLVTAKETEPQVAAHAADVLHAISSGGWTSAEPIKWLIEVRDMPGRYRCRDYARRILEDMKVKA